MADDTGCAAPDVSMRSIRSVPSREYVQCPLPYVRGAVHSRCQTGLAVQAGDFAHPFERTFAELLSFYGVRWSYEPTAFALSWWEDGSAREMFTPDFYLPDHKLYVELTAMRQRLVTRKHRKVRRMRELYPHVDVKLLYRRDYHRLASACRPFSATSSPSARPGTTLRDAGEIAARVAAMADAIGDTYVGVEPPLAVAVGAGGTALLDAVGMHLAVRRPAIELERDQIAVLRFRADRVGRRVGISRRPTAELRGRTVVLFVDIVSSGLTLSYLTAWLRRRGVIRIEVCALLDRKCARLFGPPLTYVGFLAPHDLVVGYGLSLFREFRGLDHIAALATNLGGSGLGDGPSLPFDPGPPAAR